MKIITWNLNSVRSRLERLLALLDRESPDAICLQELKVVNDQFPFPEIEDAGYHAYVHGQKTYNGVAILTRREVESWEPGMGDDSDDDQARIVRATLSGVKIISVYVPNGGSVGTDKWRYKLEWLGRLRSYLNSNVDPGEPAALCGDFNIAPEERDVNRLEQWSGTVLFHPQLTEIYTGLVKWGLVDTIRMHHHEEGPYTWWDYRMLGFPKNNGLRIDHILATPVLAQRCTAARVDRDERKGKKPSDHAPVVAEFADE